MATISQEEAGSLSEHQPPLHLPRLRWSQILAISILWFALSLHWSALGFIILPSQVLKMVGELHKGEALAFVLVPGAFVALFSSPLIGFLSDRTRGTLARWGRRRPYILLGTLINVIALIWMALAPSLVWLLCAYLLVQFSSNVIQAPFHALLPDIVPPEQRGLASGVMGLLQVLGGIGGVLIAGRFVDASSPLPIYQQGLWFTYALVIIILIAFMLVTIVSIRERATASAQLLEQEERQQSAEEKPAIRPWLPRTTLLTIIGTGVALGVTWGMMYLWNIQSQRLAGIQISTDVQQVVLEVVATIGLLRIFNFSPRRTPDFAWVLLTRMIMMMGIYTIQTFLQYYMKDVVGAPHPEAETTNFVIVVSLTSLVSALAAGWLSDRLGRKRMVYISGGFMALVGLIFMFLHSLPLILAAGAIFGLGYGAYQSVDWALVADTLPSQRDYARDMGVWNVSLAIPQIIAPVLGGPLIDHFTRSGQSVLGFQLIFAMAIVYCLVGTVTVRFVRGVKR